MGRETSGEYIDNQLRIHEKEEVLRKRGFKDDMEDMKDLEGVRKARIRDQLKVATDEEKEKAGSMEDVLERAGTYEEDEHEREIAERLARENPGEENLGDMIDFEKERESGEF